MKKYGDRSINKKGFCGRSKLFQAYLCTAWLRTRTTFIPHMHE